MKTQYGARLTRVALLPATMAAALLLSACAATPVAPTTALSEAREAIAHAEQSDGRQHASGDLDAAKQRLEMAEQAVAEENMVEAERLAREAQVTAELASARAVAAKAVEVNRQMGRGAAALTEEMRRSGEQR